MRALSIINVFRSSIGSNLRWTLFATVARAMPHRGIRDVRLQSFAKIDIFGNEYDSRRWNRGRELFCPPSVTENASNAFVLPYFAIFYSIDGKKSINSGSTKRGKLNERVIYS